MPQGSERNDRKLRQGDSLGTRLWLVGIMNQALSHPPTYRRRRRRDSAYQNRSRAKPPDRTAGPGIGRPTDSKLVESAFRGHVGIPGSCNQAGGCRVFGSLATGNAQQWRETGCGSASGKGSPVDKQNIGETGRPTSEGRSQPRGQPAGERFTARATKGRSAGNKSPLAGAVPAFRSGPAQRL